MDFGRLQHARTLSIYQISAPRAEVRQVLRGDQHALGGGKSAAAGADPSRHRKRKPVSGTTCGNRFMVGPVQTLLVRSSWLLSAMRNLVWPNNRLNSMVD